MIQKNAPVPGSIFDHSTHEEFFDYYSKESMSDESYQRMIRIKDIILRKLNETRAVGLLNVADIGCGAGTLSLLWAKEGHNVHGLDVNQSLLELGQKRAKEAGLTIDYRVGSATALPWANETMDVCIAPELLEHVADWKACLSEFTRILKPQGVLFISTANKLCPKQYEFNLPLYSWYPGFLKQYYEKLAVTTRPEIANYAKYPAVNWFSFYQLRDELAKMGLKEAYDRFDIMDESSKSALQRSLLRVIKQSKILRWFAQVASPSLTLLAIKK